MTEKQPNLLLAKWASNLEALDLEIARMALLCEAKILEPGVIDRVLKKDVSVCGTANPAAFEKLRNLLMMYFALREKSIDAVGQTETIGIEQYVVERLKKHFPQLGTKWPPV